MHAQRRLRRGRLNRSRLVVYAILFGETDDGDRVGEVGVLVASALDQEAFAFQPFDVGGAVDDDAWKGRMSGLGGPGAHEPIERFQRWFGRHLVAQSDSSWRLRCSSRSTFPSIMREICSLMDRGSVSPLASSSMPAPDPGTPSMTSPCRGSGRSMSFSRRSPSG